LVFELLNFSILQSDNSVELSWTTASETNNDYFIIEKSKDAEIFSEIVKINGAGNSDINLNYYFLDENPFTELSYYRLKQVDFNGTYSYSKTIAIKSSSSKNEIRIDPNPATTETIFYFKEEIKGETKIELLDAQGKIIFKKFEKKEMTSYLLNLESFEKGYFISVENNYPLYKSRLVVL
jgi:hypothetical protein